MTGEELKTLRRDAGRTQAQLARELGMAREMVGRMERGLKVITLRTALAVEHLLRCKPGKENDHER